MYNQGGQEMQTTEDIRDLVIDWDMGPTDAVTLYLEWGNNSWHADHKPVTGKHDYSIYFAVDTWEGEPRIRLIRRNSDEAVELAEYRLPKELADNFMEEVGYNKGVYAITDEIRTWLEKTIFN